MTITNDDSRQNPAYRPAPLSSTPFVYQGVVEVLAIKYQVSTFATQVAT